MKRLMCACGLCLAGIAGFGAIRSVTPNAWNGDCDGWQMKRHLEKMAVVTNGGARIVFVGDSITHFWERSGQLQWQKYFADGPYRALNLGTGGDRTQNVLWRLTEGGELDGYEAKCILLMIGTNNTGDEDPPIDTILGIREVLRVIRAKQPAAKVVLTAILPRDPRATDPRRIANNTVNREIAKFADGKDVFWCDFSEQLLTRDGRLPRDIMPDRIHPGPYGYEIWAAAVKPFVDYALAAGRLPAPPNRYAPFVREETFLLEEPHALRPEARTHEKWWIDRLLEKRNAIADNASGEFDVVMVGDSITHRWERPGDGEGRPLFSKLKETYSILNLGYGGDQTRHLLWRLRNGELDGYKAKLFTVLIGTNNWQHDPNDVAAGIRGILDLIRAKHPESKVLLYPLFPRSEKPTDGPRVAVDRVNGLIRPYADGSHVIWADFNAKFLEADGTLPRRLMTDLLHPNAEGYRIWYDELVPYLRKYCGK